MTKYGRSYYPPVFHLEKASEDQMKVMRIVFETLLDSNIDFAVVYPGEDRADELNIQSYGDFSLNEKGDILREVVEMYANDTGINHITMV